LSAPTPTAPPRIVFAGTPEFSLPCLDALVASGNTPVAVYTQPDRPSGRGRKLSASPVKQRALELGLPVYQPLSLRDPAAQAELAALAPDLLVVIAYGLILPPAVLALPRYGCWNIHASLLPRWRGAAPIQRALLAGDDQTGVCLMQMERGLDTGPVLIERACPINVDDTALSLHDRPCAAGCRGAARGPARHR
jgi:methionyl-tRNA formyltransferase